MTFASRLAAVTFAALMCWTVPASAPPCSRRRCHRRSSNTSSLRRCRHRSSNTSSLHRCRHRNASRGRTRSNLANWSRPGTSSSAMSRAGWRPSSSARSANGAFPTATYSARRARALLWQVCGMAKARSTPKRRRPAGILQGASVGFDWGGDGARTMTLVYNLPATNAIYQRFVGIDGSAYIIGGFGMTALTANNIVLVPIRFGIGLRLGANVGYLKFTPRATWNPFWAPILRHRRAISPGGFRLTRQWTGAGPAGRGNVINESISVRSDHR